MTFSFALAHRELRAVDLDVLAEDDLPGLLAGGDGEDGESSGRALDDEAPVRVVELELLEHPRPRVDLDRAGDELVRHVRELALRIGVDREEPVDLATVAVLPDVREHGFHHAAGLRPDDFRLADHVAALDRLPEGCVAVERLHVGDSADAASVEDLRGNYDSCTHCAFSFLFSAPWRPAPLPLSPESAEGGPAEGEMDFSQRCEGDGSALQY